MGKDLEEAEEAALHDVDLGLELRVEAEDEADLLEHLEVRVAHVEMRARPRRELQHLPAVLADLLKQPLGEVRRDVRAGPALLPAPPPP